MLKLERLGLSILIVCHILAVVLWILPECALKKCLGGWTAYYLMPTGQWQDWAMFAPEPIRDTLALEANALDARGQFHAHAFPRMAGKPVYEALWGYRHSKFTHNMGPETAVAYREFAARHVVRALHLPASAFPVDVDLCYRVWPGPELGQAQAAPADSPRVQVLKAYRFPTLADVQP